MTDCLNIMEKETELSNSNQLNRVETLVDIHTLFDVVLHQQSPLTRADKLREI